MNKDRQEEKNTNIEWMGNFFLFYSFRQNIPSDMKGTCAAVTVN